MTFGRFDHELFQRQARCRGIGLCLRARLDVTSDFSARRAQKETCRQKINLIAHSMGSYGLRLALQQARKIADGESLQRIFDSIVLTAADEDSDTFQ